MLARPEKPSVVAAQKFIERGFTPGEVIPREWFVKALGLRTEAEILAEFAKDSVRFNLARKRENWEFFGGMEELRSILLEEHNILLRNERGEGYIHIPNNAHGKVAFDDAAGGANRLIHKGIREMSHIESDGLTAAEIAENTDRKNRLADFAEAIARAKRIKHPFK